MGWSWVRVAAVWRGGTCLQQWIPKGLFPIRECYRRQWNHSPFVDPSFLSTICCGCIQASVEELTYISLKFMAWRIFWNKDYMKIRLIFPFFEVFPLCIRFFSYFPLLGWKALKGLTPRSIVSHLMIPGSPLKQHLWMDIHGLRSENFSEGRGVEAPYFGSLLVQLRTVLTIRRLYSWQLFRHSIFTIIVYRLIHPISVLRTESFVYLSERCISWKYFFPSV